MPTNQPMLLNCPACGAPLDYDGSSSVIRCKFCGNRSLVEGAAANQAADPGSTLDEIRRLVSGGNIEEAVKRFRDLYQVDDEEARQAVQAIQGGWTASFSSGGTQSAAELTQAMQKIQSLLANGDKLGAIKVYRETFDSSLERAKNAIDLIQNGQMNQDSNGFNDLGRQMPPPPPMQPAKRRGGGVVAIVILILLVGGGAMALFLFHNTGTLAKHYNPGDPMVFVPSGQGDGFELASTFYDPDADNHFVGLIDPASGKLLWHGAAFEGDSTPDAIVGTNDMLYVAVASNLLAYHMSDGSLAWQTVMPDNLAYGKPTLLVTGGRVITDNADETIQAYDANSGQLVWDQQLGTSENSLRLIGNTLVEMVENSDNNDIALDFIDPVSGAINSTFAPTCTSDGMEYNLDAEGQFIAIPGEQALLMILSQGCIEKLDLSSLQVTWTATYSDWLTPLSDGLPTLLTDSTFYYGNEGDLLAVDLASGEMKTLVSNKNYDLLPLTVMGDTLIVRAKRTTGTERFEIWGVDVSSGAQLWQMDEQNSDPIDPPDEMAGLIDKTDWGWTWSQSGEDFALLTFKGEPDQAVLETFDPKDGSSKGQQTMDLSKVFGDFYSPPTVIGRQGSVLYLNADGAIYAVDLTSGTAKFIY
jgi:outer membrane protein assembly factor BamB/ribosomal protein L7/L12/DNA-directed RNA polymerase subunit RPC12/RpoP